MDQSWKKKEKVNNEINCRVLLALKRGNCVRRYLWPSRPWFPFVMDDDARWMLHSGRPSWRVMNERKLRRLPPPHERIIRGRRSQDVITRCGRRRWSNPNKNESEHFFFCLRHGFCLGKFPAAADGSHPFRRIIVCALWTIVSPVETVMRGRANSSRSDTTTATWPTGQNEKCSRTVDVKKKRLYLFVWPFQRIISSRFILIQLILILENFSLIFQIFFRIWFELIHLIFGKLILGNFY
jgi:hypothetical protein